jgi:hypothetical protein
MKTFIIKSNIFLKKDIIAFYNTDYIWYKKTWNPDYINILKNTYNSYSEEVLNEAVDQLKNTLNSDIVIICKLIESPLMICVVPRAKNEKIYKPDQLLFKKTIKDFIKYNNLKHNLIDGVDNIIRHTNTKTTHLSLNTPNYNNDWDMPYVWITKKTCNIENKIKDHNILLIDDIYTKDINIDEDVIQTLLDKWAKSVYFYSIGKTAENYKNLDKNKLSQLLTDLYIVKNNIALFEEKKQNLQNQIFSSYSDFESENIQWISFKKWIAKSYTFNNITEKELIEKAKKICPNVIEEKISKWKVVKSQLKNYITEKETSYIRVINPNNK